MAERVVTSLNQNHAGSAALVPMDGFHLDNSVLVQLGRLFRKGAPDTFDAYGLCNAVSALAQGGRDVFLPTFDREKDQALAGHLHVRQQTKIIVLEGNYLLLDDEPWNELRPFFTGSIFLAPAIETLEHRLKCRWKGLGFSEEEADQKTYGNDMVNARLVLENSIPADLILA